MANTHHWGQHLMLDLNGCERDKIGDADNIRAWIQELIPAIDMIAYGEPILERFALHDHHSGGYTLLQLIETSNIAAHFAENIGQAFIDVFSCKPFDNVKVTTLCREFFAPVQIVERTVERGAFADG